MAHCVFTSIDAGLGAMPEVAHDLGIPMVQYKFAKAPSAEGRDLAGRTAAERISMRIGVTTCYALDHGAHESAPDPAKVFCHSTAIIRQLIPEPMPSKATRSPETTWPFSRPMAIVIGNATEPVLPSHWNVV